MEVADGAGNTALHMAAAGGHLGVVHALLQRQASPNVRNQRNETAFQVAGTRGFVEVARAMNPFVRLGEAARGTFIGLGPQSQAFRLTYQILSVI